MAATHCVSSAAALARDLAAPTIAHADPIDS
jgi:hypothetical protein